MTHLDYCFVKPIIDNNVLNQNKEKPLTGILKYSNNILKDMGVEEEDLVGFTPVSEFEFIKTQIEHMKCWPIKAPLAKR